MQMHPQRRHSTSLHLPTAPNSLPPTRSFFAVGNPKNITRTLAAPHGRVLFAGEATSDKPATGEPGLL